MEIIPVKAFASIATLKIVNLKNSVFLLQWFEIYTKT